MKKNLRIISELFVLMVVIISATSNFVYAVSDESTKFNMLFKVDPYLMSILIAPLAIITLLVVTFHAAIIQGWKSSFKMVGTGMVIAYVLEEIGVHTGIVFGRYYFTPLMGPKLDVIPIAIFCGLVMLIYISWVITNLLIDGSPTPTSHTLNLIILKSIVGAMVVTTFDLNFDPFCVENGWWVWLDGGSFYGVPIHNYIGWFVVAFVTYIIHGYQFYHEQVISLELASVGVRRLSIAPVIIYGFSGFAFVIMNFAGQLGLISFYVFGIPFFVALWKWIIWYKNSFELNKN